MYPQPVQLREGCRRTVRQGAVRTLMIVMPAKLASFCRASSSEENHSTFKNSMLRSAPAGVDNGRSSAALSFLSPLDPLCDACGPGASFGRRSFQSGWIKHSCMSFPSPGPPSTLSRELLHHRQAAEGTRIRELVAHEIRAPTLVRTRRHRRGQTLSPCRFPSLMAVRLLGPLQAPVSPRATTAAHPVRSPPIRRTVSSTGSRSPG